MECAEFIRAEEIPPHDKQLPADRRGRKKPLLWDGLVDQFLLLSKSDRPMNNESSNVQAVEVAHTPIAHWKSNKMS